jgi:Flp pilus assembly protein TadB
LKNRANLAAISIAFFVLLEFRAPLSLVLALIAGWITKRSVAILEPAHVRAERLRLIYIAPEFAELIALCLDSGLPLLDSIRAAGQVLGSPIIHYADEATALLQMGGDAQQAFSSWRQVAALAPIASIIESAVNSGASGATALRRSATRLRRARTSQVKRQVRSVGVRATLPIGLCFLPSFILGAVFPIAAQVFYSLLSTLPPVFFNINN